MSIYIVLSMYIFHKYIRTCTFRERERERKGGSERERQREMQDVSLDGCPSPLPY